MNKIQTENAPAAIGPYSQAVVAGNLVFTSGQIPVEPATGAIPEGIEAQAEQSCRNVGALLEAAGTDFSRVIRLTKVTLKSMKRQKEQLPAELKMAAVQQVGQGHGQFASTPDLKTVKTPINILNIYSKNVLPTTFLTFIRRFRLTVISVALRLLRKCFFKATSALLTTESQSFYLLYRMTGAKVLLKESERGEI